MNYKSLARLAVSAKTNAYAPFSDFHVGAALLTRDGKIYTGCNVESSSYSLTICAERNAVFKAYSEGERSFKAIAIAGDLPGFCSPCGACRQVLSDLCGNIDVVLINGSDEIAEYKLADLLPMAFGMENLKDNK